jgi:hypothetical protein
MLKFTFWNGQKCRLLVNCTLPLCNGIYSICYCLKLDFNCLLQLFVRGLVTIGCNFAEIQNKFIARKLEILICLVVIL